MMGLQAQLADGPRFDSSFSAINGFISPTRTRYPLSQFRSDLFSFSGRLSVEAKSPVSVEFARIDACNAAVETLGLLVHLIWIFVSVVPPRLLLICALEFCYGQVFIFSSLASCERRVASFGFALLETGMFGSDLACNYLLKAGATYGFVCPCSCVSMNRLAESICWIISRFILKSELNC